MAHSQRGQKDGVNVQVILRCRPFSKAEQSRVESNRQFVLCKEEAKEVNIFPNVGGGKQLERSFHFDKVFGPDSGQDRLYDQAVAPIVEEVLEGFNCTIFAYGQTGTGKTYTMEGGDRDSTDGNNLSKVAGVIPRAIHQIFTTLDRNDSEYTVKCSFLELYNEETTDLLAVGDRQDQKLRILEDRNGVVIQGLEEFIVKSSVDIYALLDRGSAKRKTAETQLNKQSSRSHSVFCITVHMREIAADGEEVIKIGKLYLVDLAGSENVSRSGAAGTMAKEAGSINKSLLTLGRVITALVEGSGHIPYRDSKLTRLLRDSLGGKTKTCIIATIAPTAHCQDETLSTLDYAHRAKNIRNRPEVNQKISKTAHIKELNAEIDRLKAELFATREKNGIYLPVDQFEQREESSKINAARIESLEGEVEQLGAKHKAHTDKLDRQISQLQQELQEATEACEKARLGMQERDFLIATHNRSESAILAQASTVTAELQQASQAVDALYCKLGTNVQREQGNAQVVRQLQQAAQAGLAALQADLAAAMSASQTHLQQAKTQLDKFLNEKDGQMATIQERLGCIQGQLSLVASTAAQGAEAMKDVALRAVHDLQRTEKDFICNNREHWAQAEAANAVVFQSMADSHLAHKSQLEGMASSRCQTSQAHLSTVQDVVTQGKAGVGSLHNIAEVCRGSAETALEAQSRGLRELKHDFSRKIAEEKGILMEKMMEMLNEFAAKSAVQVSDAADSLVGLSQTSKEALGSYQGELQGAAATAQGSLDAGQQSAIVAEKERLKKLDEQEAALAASLEQNRTHCEMLQLQMQHSTAAAAQAQDAHLVSIESNVAASVDLISKEAAKASNSCSEAVAAAKESCNEFGAECVRDNTADKATGSQVLQLASGVDGNLTEFGGRHKVDLSDLASGVHKSTAEDFVQDPMSGVLQDKPAVKLPPATWWEDMRTPSAEFLLAEFRRQKDVISGTHATANEAPLPEATEPLGATESPALTDEEMDDASEQPASKRGENADPNPGGEAAQVPVKSKIPSLKARPGPDARGGDSGRRKRVKA